MKIHGIASFILFCLCILLVLPGTAAPLSSIGGNVFSWDYSIEDFQSSLQWSPFSPAIVQAAGGSNVYISDLDVITEYVKITNKGRDSIVMTGWRLTNKDGSNSIRFIEWTNPDGSKFNYELRGYSTVTIYSPREGNPTGTSLYWPEEMWYDEGDTAYLYDNAGTLVSTYRSTGTGPTTVPTIVPTTAPTQVPTGTGTGTLSVTSTPGSAMVFLDGVFKGITPITITGVPAGTHQLKVHRIGYDDYSTSVTVLPGQTVPVPVPLNPSSGPTTVPTIVPTTAPTQVPTGTGTGTLSVTSIPGGAMVFLDGVFKGITPKTIPGVPAGTHQLKVHRIGYEDFSASIAVIPGQTLEVPVALEGPPGPTLVPTIVPTPTPTRVPAGTGTLAITSSPTGAKVFLDFTFIGYTPLTVPDVPAGLHRISIRKSMYRNNSTTVMVNPDTTTTISVTLSHIWEGINPFK